MTNSDKLLERLIKRVNDSATPFDITLTVGGALITGRLIPRKVWLETNITVLRQGDDMQEFADEFAIEGGSFDTEEYLHLLGAKTIFGEEPPIAAGTGLLRIPTGRVDSWAVGRVAIEFASE